MSNNSFLWLTLLPRDGKCYFPLFKVPLTGTCGGTVVVPLKPVF